MTKDRKKAARKLGTLLIPYLVKVGLIHDDSKKEAVIDFFANYLDITWDFIEQSKNEVPKPKDVSMYFLKKITGSSSLIATYTEKHECAVALVSLGISVGEGVGEDFFSGGLLSIIAVDYFIKQAFTGIPMGMPVY